MYEHLIEIQPNREPFLFIDTIVECNEEKNSRTIKYHNKDEWFLNVIGKMTPICQRCFNWKQ